MQTWEKRPDQLDQFTNHCYFLATFLCKRSKSFSYMLGNCLLLTFTKLYAMQQKKTPIKAGYYFYTHIIMLDEIELVLELTRA